MAALKRDFLLPSNSDSRARLPLLVHKVAQFKGRDMIMPLSAVVVVAVNCIRWLWSVPELTGGTGTATRNGSGWVCLSSGSWPCDKWDTDCFQGIFDLCALTLTHPID